MKMTKERIAGAFDMSCFSGREEIGTGNGPRPMLAEGAAVFANLV